MARPRFNAPLTDPVRPAINVGAGLDIPTGEYLPGIHGEMILNGGFYPLTGCLAKPNFFKTTLKAHHELSLLNAFNDSSASVYDTESTLYDTRFKMLQGQHDRIKEEDLFQEGHERIRISNPSVILGEGFYDDLSKFMREKIKNKKEILRDSPFLDRSGKALMRMMEPDAASIDSLSQFKTSDIVDKAESHELGDSKRNMMYMHSGRNKAMMIEELSQMAPASSTYVWLTGHIGRNMSLDERSPPSKQMQFFEQNSKALGTTDRFLYLTNNLWWIQKAEKYINQNTKASELPLPGETNKEGDVDLVKLTIVNLRGKGGAAGIPMTILASQSRGVLSYLTQFQHLRDNSYFGLDGSVQNYTHTFLPDIKLSRTTVHGKLLDNPKLQRAVQFTSEMLQIEWFMKEKYVDLWCTPQELYKDIKEQGYDWDQLLSTRGYWMFDNDKQATPYLSTLDLLRMRKKLYKPHWL